MKKILFILLLLFGSFFASAQIYPGYTNINQRYQWEAGIFKGLRIPAGDSAQFRTGQLPASGSIYWDTTDNNTPAGLYSYYNGDWILNGQPTTVNLPNGLLAGGTVTPLGGYQFAVQAAIYRIDNIVYTSDSGTVTIDSADATLNRIDRIYLSSDELIHVLEGELATNALEPQVESDQIGLAFITIPAGSDPFITSLVVYNENTESVVTNTGTTTDGNNATNVYVGTKSLNVTNINNGDLVLFTKAPSLSTWDLTGFNGLSMFIKLKTVMPAAGSLRVRIEFTGGNSSEVIIPLDKANITTYQAITIAASSFGTIANIQVNRVRFRYVRAGSITNYTGFYLDNMFFQTGVVQSGSGGTVTSVGINYVGDAFTESAPVTSAGTLTLTPTGNSGQYINGLGNLATFPTFVDTVSGLDGRSRVADGGVADGRELFLQTVNGTFPGLATADMYTRVYTNYYISNANSNIGDSLAFEKNDSTTGIKLLVAGTGITLTDTDSTIVIAASGGGGGFFTGSTATANTVQDADGFDFTLQNVGDFVVNATELLGLQLIEGGITNSFGMGDAGNMTLTSSGGGSTATFNIYPGTILFDSDEGNYAMTNLTDDPTATKVLVWNSGDGNRIYTQDISGLGGGGSSLLPVTGTGTATGDIEGDLAGNEVAIIDNSNGGNTNFRINNVTGSSFLQSYNTTGSDNIARFEAATLATQAEATLIAQFESSDIASIVAHAESGVSTITHTADQHVFVGTVTIPTPFTLGATSVTSTGTQFNYLNAATGTTGTTSSNLVFSTTPTITTPVFSGAVSTTAAVQNGTNASGTGQIPYEYHIFVRSNETLANSNADQNLFTNTSHDVITVLANTTYRFYGSFDLAHLSVSHSLSLGFTPTTAVVTNISYNTMCWVTAIGTNTASQTSNRIKSTATTLVNAAGANAVESVWFEGWITIGATGGTITPQIKFSADPTGTITLQTGSEFHIYAVGNDTFTESGPIN